MTMTNIEYKKKMSSLAVERFSCVNAPNYMSEIINKTTELSSMRSNRIKYSDRLRDKNINLTINNSANFRALCPSNSNGFKSFKKYDNSVGQFQVKEVA